MFKGIRRLFKKSVVESEEESVLDIVSGDQETIDGYRLALHDICIRYDCPGMDAMVHETWRQLCGKLMCRLEGTKF